MGPTSVGSEGSLSTASERRGFPLIISLHFECVFSLCAVFCHYVEVFDWSYEYAYHRWRKVGSGTQVGAQVTRFASKFCNLSAETHPAIANYGVERSNDIDLTPSAPVFITE